MWLTGPIVGNLLAFFITLLVIFIGGYKWSFQYWQRKNFPHLKPQFPYGNFESLFSGKEHYAVTLQHLYDVMKKKGWKHGGVYVLMIPYHVIIDLELVKNVMKRDFEYFPGRGLYYNEKRDPLSAHLFNLTGSKWKNMRTKLTPNFTPGKLKMMFQTVVNCEVKLQNQIELECEKKTPIDIKEVFGSFNTEVLGSCVFGLECNTFMVHGRKLLNNSFGRQTKRTLINIFPKLGLMLNVCEFPVDFSNYCMKIVKDTVDYREKNNINRKDFMQMLIDMKNSKPTEDEDNKHDGTALTLEEISAQSFIFFIGGYETSSSAMTFALYELARNQDIQDKVREEIERVLAKYDGKITYDAIQDMKYLNQVIDETLRMYPPIPRRCVKDYKIPDTDLVIEKGMTVLIPFLAIHYDEEFYPDPYRFDPDRFSEENKSKRHPYCYLPFGEGPRMCIGIRFALMQLKVGLAPLLKNFKFTVNSKTKEPLKMKPRCLVLAAEGDIWLDAQKI